MVYFLPGAFLCRDKFKTNTMKKIAVMWMLFCLATGASAQGNSESVSYTILQNDPQNFYPKMNINLMLGALDAGIRNVDGINFYYGVHGYYQINERIGVQANANMAWLTLGRFSNSEYPTSKNLDAGAVTFLTKSTRSKQIKVVLKMTRGTTTDGRSIQSTTYIMVPGTKEILNGVRGGLYYKTGAFGTRPLKDASLDNLGIEHASFTSIGIYAGVIRRALTNMIIKTDKYGKCMNSLGTELYVDALFIPYNSFTLLDTPTPFYTGTAPTETVKHGDDITDKISNVLGKNPIGFRIGFTGFQIAPKSVTGKKFGASYNFEFGLLPYQGWFLRGGLGITLFKKTAVTPEAK